MPDGQVFYIATLLATSRNPPVGGGVHVLRRVILNTCVWGCGPMQGRSRNTFQGTVLIAEDHQVFRMGLIQLLRRALKVKRFLEAACFAQVLEHLQDDDVTLTILDLQMPGLVAPSAITRLRLLRPEAHVVVLSGSD